MKVIDTGKRVELWLRCTGTLLSLVILDGTSSPVWRVMHDSFRPIEPPGPPEAPFGHFLPTRVTVEPAAAFASDEPSVPQQEYAVRIVVGVVPEGFVQHEPPSGSPEFHSGQSYFVRAWSTEGTDRVVFLKA